MLKIIPIKIGTNKNNAKQTAAASPRPYATSKIGG